MSRPLRGQERGYRRLTVGVSLVLLCVGLALMARDVYQMMEYKNELATLEACYNRAGSDQKAKNECGTMGIDSLPGHHVSFAFDMLITISQATLPHDAFINVLTFTAGRPGYPFFGFIISIDLAVGLVLAAVPWVVFYSVRWVARGFAGAT